MSSKIGKMLETVEGMADRGATSIIAQYEIGEV